MSKIEKKKLKNGRAYKEIDKIMNRDKWQKPLDAIMEAIPEAVRSANKEQKKMVDDSKIEGGRNG